MGLESQNANRPPGDLKTQQVDTYLRLEPKTLGVSDRCYAQEQEREREREKERESLILKGK